MNEQVQYIPPEFGKDAFNCPHCGVCVRQEWKDVIALTPNETVKIIDGLKAAFCPHCIDNQASREMGGAYTYTVWHLNRMIYPEDIGVLPPNADLREDIQKAEHSLKAGHFMASIA